MNNDLISLADKLSELTGLDINIPEGADTDNLSNVMNTMLDAITMGEDSHANWIKFLEGELSDREKENFILRYSVGHNTPVALFYLYFPSGYDDMVVQVLAGLTGGTDRIMRYDDDHILLIRMYKNIITAARMESDAAVIADTLSADAMVPVRISFEECKSDLLGLPEAFHYAKMAMKIGVSFYSNETLYPYNKRGLGKLISKLSADDCREYMEDNLGSFSISSIDEELENTINIFLDTGLSIAETAKRLFIHRNTLIYRLDKFQKLSGLDIRNFEDAITVKLTIMMDRYYK